MNRSDFAILCMAGTVVWLLTVAGCSTSGKPVSEQPAPETAAPAPAICPIAVIDLDRVAQGIGAVEKMRSALGECEQKALGELQDSTGSLFGATSPMGTDFAAYDKSAAPLVAAMSMEQQREHVKHRQAAQNQVLLRERQLRDSFLGEVRPIAFQIARDQGCQLVLTTDQVYVATAQVDITPDVVARIGELNASAAKTDAAAASREPVKLASGGSFPIR